MTVINTNTGSLYAQQALNTNARGIASVTQQLSTGKRINSSVDDAAGMAISTRLTSQIRGLNQAIRNANDAISLVQTAEGATDQITNMLQRMREITIQSSNDTNSTDDRNYLNLEMKQLQIQINKTASTTEWNGANILNGRGGDGNGYFLFQIGPNSDETIGATLPSFGSDQTINSITSTLETISGTLGASLDLSALDKNNMSPSDAVNQVGRQVNARVLLPSMMWTEVNYTITQADAASVNGASNHLSTAVATGLATLLNATEAFSAGDGLGHGLTASVNGSALILRYDTISGSASFLGMASSTSGGLDDLSNLDISNTVNNAAALSSITSALDLVVSERSKMAALINSLQFISQNLGVVAIHAQESRSRIEDTDYSQATTELAKRNIIQQAAQAMLAQANQAPQTVLQLLK